MNLSFENVFNNYDKSKIWSFSEELRSQWMVDSLYRKIISRDNDFFEVIMKKNTQTEKKKHNYVKVPIAPN